MNQLKNGPGPDNDYKCVKPKSNVSNVILSIN